MASYTFVLKTLTNALALYAMKIFPRLLLVTVSLISCLFLVSMTSRPAVDTNTNTHGVVSAHRFPASYLLPRALLNHANDAEDLLVINLTSMDFLIIFDDYYYNFIAPYYYDYMYTYGTSPYVFIVPMNGGEIYNFSIYTPYGTYTKVGTNAMYSDPLPFISGPNTLLITDVNPYLMNESTPLMPDL